MTLPFDTDNLLAIQAMKLNSALYEAKMRIIELEALLERAEKDRDEWETVACNGELGLSNQRNL